MNDLSLTIRKLHEARLELLEERKRRVEFNRLDYLFPENGKFSRHNYHKHVGFMSAPYMVRLLMGGNRVGKTETAAYETILHATGRYPKWWTGRRFANATKGWIAAVDFKVLKEAIQPKLFGDVEEGEYKFNGVVPKDCVKTVSKHTGIKGVIETITLKHTSGRESEITFKTYEQSVDSFQSAKLDWAWADEEPPLPIVNELLMRLVNTRGEGKDGSLLITFTPLKGLSDTILHFLPSGNPQDRAGATAHITQVEWDDCPHLSDETKRELLAHLPAHEREARTKGIPAVGEGAIYPFPESSYVVEPFDLPKHWARAYGFDTSNGISPCGGAWGALDKDSDILYIYSDYCRASPSIAEHVDAIKARGDWLTGAFDYAGVRSSEQEVVKIIDLYRRHGINAVNADKSVFMGINKVYERIATGRLKVFSSCRDFIREIRLYRYDEKGMPVKQNDHVMDASRYLVVTGIKYMTTEIESAIYMDNAYINHNYDAMDARGGY